MPKTKQAVGKYSRNNRNQSLSILVVLVAFTYGV